MENRWVQSRKATDWPLPPTEVEMGFDPSVTVHSEGRMAVMHKK